MILEHSTQQLHLGVSVQHTKYSVLQSQFCCHSTPPPRATAGALGLYTWSSLPVALSLLGISLLVTFDSPARPYTAAFHIKSGPGGLGCAQISQAGEVTLAWL